MKENIKSYRNLSNWVALVLGSCFPASLDGDFFNIWQEYWSFQYFQYGGVSRWQGCKFVSFWTYCYTHMECLETTKIYKLFSCNCGFSSPSWVTSYFTLSSHYVVSKTFALLGEARCWSGWSPIMLSALSALKYS